MSQPTVTVIGTGALGSTLAKALYKNGYSIKSLYNRTIEKSRQLAPKVHAKRVSEFPSSKEDLGSLIFLTVHDSEIAEAASRLGEIADNFEGYWIIHCSGSQPANILKSLEKKGARIAALHPLQTFTSNSTPEDFRDIYFDLEADRIASAPLEKVAGALGGKILKISKDAKPYLHAAAVVASNYLVTLLDISGNIAELGGINEVTAVQSLLPLVRRTLQNLESGNTSEALTGPIKRGDIETVSRHLQLLKGDKNLLRLYKMLGLQTLKITDEEEKFSHQQRTELRRLLNENE